MLDFDSIPKCFKIGGLYYENNGQVNSMYNVPIKYENETMYVLNKDIIWIPLDDITEKDRHYCVGSDVAIDYYHLRSCLYNSKHISYCQPLIKEIDEDELLRSKILSMLD